MLKIETKRSNFSTEYLIEGPLREVNDEVDRLHRDYHPMGYGTTLKSLVQRPDGSAYAIVRRANSCD
jgi:hypothetical protein